MKKIFLSIVAFCVTVCFFSVSIRAEGVDVSAQAAILMEAQTGKVLYTKNENEKRPIASTTKILTALLCLESGNLDEAFVVDPEAIKVEGSSMGLREGDIVTKRALCYGMLLPSGNDAANATAVKLAGSFDAFSEMMNRRAHEIGMLNSYFVTPSGLDAEGHGSTAYDMALLTREALKNPEFCEICSQQTAKLSYGNPPYDRWLKNSNKLLASYAGCVGVKTGFTDDAGRCLISAATRDGVTLICVTLKAPSDWADHTKLLDYGFSVVKLQNLPVPEIPFSIALVGGTQERLPIALSVQPTAPLMPEDAARVTSEVFMEKFVYAPARAGAKVGEIRYLLDGIQVAAVDLVASENVEADMETADITLLEKIKSFMKKLF